MDPASPCSDDSNNTLDNLIDAEDNVELDEVCYQSILHLLTSKWPPGPQQAHKSARTVFPISGGKKRQKPTDFFPNPGPNFGQDHMM